jgi:hypothetical protein
MVRTFLKVYMELGSYFVSARTNKRHHHFDVFYFTGIFFCIYEVFTLEFFQNVPLFTTHSHVQTRMRETVRHRSRRLPAQALLQHSSFVGKPPHLLCSPSPPSFFHTISLSLEFTSA